MSRKHYDESFKRHLVELYYSGKSVLFLASEYNVSRENLYVWIRKYKETEPVEEGSLSLSDQRKLLKELEQVKLENEILKKAVLIIGKK